MKKRTILTAIMLLLCISLLPAKFYFGTTANYTFRGMIPDPSWNKELPTDPTPSYTEHEVGGTIFGLNTFRKAPSFALKYYTSIEMLYSHNYLVVPIPELNKAPYMMMVPHAGISLYWKDDIDEKTMLLIGGSLSYGLFMREQKIQSNVYEYAGIADMNLIVNLSASAAVNYRFSTYIGLFAEAELGLDILSFHIVDPSEKLPEEYTRLNIDPFMPLNVTASLKLGMTMTGSKKQ